MNRNDIRKLTQILTAGVLFLALTGGPGIGQTAERVPDHEVRSIQGWTVHLDKNLLSDERRNEREEALELLEIHLVRIRKILRKKNVRRIQQIPIVLDLRHDELSSMQYHPSAGWLRNHGYPEEMEHMVHIPRVKRFTSRSLLMNQPMVVMHELAHGYHDRVLGFDHDKIESLFERVRASGRLDEVFHVSGKKKRHYALKDIKEFFAEMTEAYLGSDSV